MIRRRFSSGAVARRMRKPTLLIEGGNFRRALVFIGCVLALTMGVYIFQKIKSEEIGKQEQKAFEQQAIVITTSVDDLRDVYDNLNTAYPNQQINRFTRSCGRASDVMGNGPIGCGADFTVLPSIDDPDISKKVDGLLKNHEHFLVTEIVQTKVYYSVPSIHYSFNDVRSSLSCSIDLIMYPDAKFKEVYVNSSFHNGVNAIRAVCSTKTLLNYIPGFERH